MRFTGLAGQLFCLGLFSAIVYGQAGPSAWSPQVPAPAIQNYGHLPLGFEKQAGESGERFVARGQGYVIGLERGKATIGVVDKDKDSRAVSLEFAGSKPGNAITGQQLPGKINYIRGNDPGKWQLGLSSYERVTYPNTYPGIDVVYYGNRQQLEFDLVVKPGANPGVVRLKVEGADKLSIDGSGALILGEAGGDLTIALPQIYQEVNGKKKNIPGHYTIAGRDEVAFRVDPWDHTRPLVIDPSIVYSTIFGSVGSSASEAIALDSSGNIFIAGYTFDVDFPTVNAFQNSLKGSSSNNPDAFVTKINPAGTALIYSTYLGGSGFDYIEFGGLAVDSTGAAWVTGQTQSSDFPLLNAAQPTFGGSTDAFVARFNSAGVLQFSTYLGGTSSDYGYGIAVDSSNNGYVTGNTQSSDFPTTAGTVNTSNPQQDGFVTKYSPAGAVLYSTLLGGTQCCTQGYGIAVDSAGDAYVTGTSGESTLTGAPGGGAQTTNNGENDAFVVKLNPTATALLYFTFLGGTGFDEGNAIAVDAAGDAYIGGYTYSTGLATAGAAQTAFAGVYDGFAAELNPAGSAFSYVTYLGGNRTNSLSGLALDGSGNVYLTGYTDSTNFPAVAAVQTLPINGVSLFNSTNTGASFAGFDSNIPAGAVSQISINPAGTSAVVLTEGGIYRTVNGGASWTLQFSTQFYFSNSYITRGPAVPGAVPIPGTLYAVQCCAAVYKSTDDGVTWNFASNPSLNNGIQGILADPLNAGTVYLFGATSPYVYKSTDSGTTFNPSGTGLPAQVSTMAAATDGSLYAGTNGFGIYKSTNQGGSWVAVNTGLPPNTYAGAYSLSASGTTLYFANGYIYETTNGGASWAATPGGYVGASQVAASAQQNANAPQNAAAIYAVTYYNTVVESSDGGMTWNSPATGLPSSFVYYYGAELVVDPSDSTHVLLVVQVFDTGYVAKLNSTGSALLYSTYLGGSQYTEPSAIATDGAGNAYVTGYTSGSGFPMTSTALPTGMNGSFITKISDLSAGCANITVTPGSALAPQFGGTLTFSVVIPSGCTYNASTDQPWAVITSGASGTGVGTVTVQITGQPGTTPLTATLFVNGSGTQVPITLPGESCTYSLDMLSYPVPAAGGTVSAILTATAGCPWAVTNSYSSRVAVTSGSSGTGNGTISLAVAPNPYNVPMNYSLEVGTAEINIAQASAQLALTTTSVPSGAVGAYYATVLAATGGTPPYSNWTVASGSLPPGLTLNSATGVISGIPTTQTGSPFSFGITVQDSMSNTSSAQALMIGIGPFATYPGQNENLTAPRSTVAQPLLIPFATNQTGYDTAITISNTSLDTIGTTAQSGTCTISYYGTGAPLPSMGLALPGGTLAAGASTSFLLSSFAPGFQGYVIVNCTFPLARGTADIIYNAGQPNSAVIHEVAQVLTLPRTVPAAQSFLFPFVTNQAGFDTGIVLANTSSDPFGASGATPASGTCTLNFYGSGAPVPNTGVAVPGGTLASGASTAFQLSSIAPGFQGYVIASCNFGAVAGFAFVGYNLTQNGGYTYSETPETIAFPRSSSPQPLLFPAVTNQNGSDTGIAIANTSSDPFGTTPTSGSCTLNFYGASAPASPFTTSLISPGTVYTTTISAIAPGFQGYMTASCAFGTPRGFAFVQGNVALNNYSETAEVLPIPRSAATPSTLLFLNTSNVGGVDTSITISNTSQDSFGTTATSGICTINYSGSTNPGSQNTAVAAGGQYSFLLSQTAPGFTGYIVASCTFPQARGIAEIVAGTAPTITTSTLPGGTVGTAYSQTLTATGGVPPYNNWTPVSGSFPPGLLLNAATGVISGTPTTATGSPFNFGVIVKDSANSTSPIQNLSIAIAAGATPVVSGIINGGDNSPPPLAPGSLASLFGANLASTTATAPGVPAPFTLGGTSISVSGTAAALLFVSPGQITFQIPYETAVGNATITVTSNSSTSAGFQFAVVPAAPGINLIQSPNNAPNTAANPIAPGATAQVYFTGLGATNPSVADGAGAPSTPPAVPVAASSVTVGGLAASVPFIGLTPGSVGLAQANVQIPAGLQAGSYAVIVTVNGRPSLAATIYVSGSAPSIISVTPNTVPPGSSATLLTISGSNFGGGSTVSFTPPGGSATAVTPTTIQATQIQVAIPAALLTTAGTAQVAVTNGLGTVSNQVSFTISQPTQTISFDAIPSQILGISPFPIAAQSSAFLPVALNSVTSAVCTTASGLVMLLTPGTCSITASQGGSAGIAAATPVTRSFTVSQAKASAASFTAATNSPFTVGAAAVPFSVAVGDFNGDGIPDLATANFQNGTVTVLLGSGQSGFAPAPGSPFAVGTQPVALAVGDFNGDGFPDLAIANFGGGNVTVLLGNGAGGFTPAPGSPFAAGTQPAAVSVGDFNGDGIQDLAVPNSTSAGTLTVLVGNGSGGFAPSAGSPFAAGFFPTSVAVGDFNRDGFQDLAIANLQGFTVTVLLGNGSGGFSASPGSPVSVMGNLSFVVAGDFNGDGIADLAATDSNGAGLYVLLGNGAGGFAPAPGSPFAVGPNPNSVAVADYNGDGIPDLAVANNGSGTVTVLLGTGLGGFTEAPGSPIAVGTEPISVAVADLNGDGIEDLAVANENSSNVTVLLGGALQAGSPGITTTSLPPGTVGTAYSQPLAASGGVAPYTNWTVVSGSFPPGLTLNAGTGVIGGTPTSTTGSPFNFSVTVQDSASSTSAAQSLSITISPGATSSLTITVSPNSISTVTGGSVSASVSASGGSGSYTFSVSGQPAGVTLGAGSLSGSPTQAGIFNAAVTVTDTNQNSASTSITINVLGLATTALPNGTTGQPYATTIVAAGGTGSSSFSATGLPAGLSLTSYGYLTGTVKTAGTYPIGVTVSSGGLSVTTTLNLTIANAGPLSISSAALPGGTVNVLYSQALGATGGLPPYTWSVSAGTLPQGLSMNTSGIVSGTPTTPGSFSYGVQVTDTAGATATATVSLTIQPAPLTITTQSLPSGMMGVDYPQLQLAVNGGVSPYTWALGSGSSLPAGMTLSTSGVLSGVPGASGTFSIGVVVTDHANGQGSTTFVLTIRTPSPDLILTTSSLTFALSSPAATPPASQMVGVQSTVPSQPIAYTVSVNPAAPWLALKNGASTPDSITASLTAAALSLSPGPYQTAITATCTSGSCNGHTLTVTASLTVTATPPELQISTGLLSFATTSAALGTLSQPINIQNAGGGTLGFASISCEAPWCVAGPSPQSLAGGVNASIPVTVDPSSLSPGFYRTQVDISSSGGKGSVPVTLFISANATLTLAPAGTLFSQPAGSAPGNPNGSFLVSVNSSNAVSFSAAIIPVPGIPLPNWLVLGTTSGSASSTQPGTVSFSIDPVAAAALAPGAYYGEIQISSAQLSNSPEDFEVVLNVSPANSPVVPDPEPGGLLFLTTVGGVLPPETVNVYSSSVGPLTFQASAATTNGGNWLSVTPATGSTSATSPGVTAVSVNTSGLSAGVYLGGVSYSLSATAVRTVNVTLIVSATAGSTASAVSAAVSSSASPKAAGCTPSMLVPAQTGLVNSFAQPAGWPTPLQIVLVNDCGATVNDGQVVATFSNGDPPLALALADPSQGLYGGTWAPVRASSQVAIKVTANAPGFPAATSQIAGAVIPNAVPVLTPNSTLHSFDPLVGGALAPGTIVAIYGQNLAAMTSQPTTIPLPTAFNGTSVVVGGMQAPIYFVSAGQINAQIPFELAPGNQYEVIVSANGALTTPQPIQLSAATPGLAAFSDGTLIAQHSDGTLVSQAAPARPGEYLVAYLAGLGDTTVPVVSGAASPSSPLAQPTATPVLTIDGAQSPILFAGLTPGLVGLYQLNFQVPAGLPAGNLTIVLSQDGQPSNQAFLPYQP